MARTLTDHNVAGMETPWHEDVLDHTSSCKDRGSIRDHCTPIALRETQHLVSCMSKAPPSTMTAESGAVLLLDWIVVHDDVIIKLTHNV
jgi:hypothetical protein